MDNQLENKLSMYQKVQGFLQLHADELSSIAVLGDLKSQFDNEIKKILDLAASAGADITGFTVDKQNKRNELKTKILKLSTALVAYGAINNDSGLVEKCDETPSGIDRMRDNDFFTYAKLILSEAHARMDLLVPFGATANDFNDADHSANVYLKSIQDPRIQINERSMTLTKLEKAFGTADDLLNGKIDQVMKIFSVSQPDLYKGYDGARGIDQTGSRTAPDYEGSVEPGALLLIAELPYLAGRQFEVQNTGKVTLTFALSAKEGVLEGKILTLEPDQTTERKTTSLQDNPAADKFYVQNADAMMPGSYKVWVVE